MDKLPRSARFYYESKDTFKTEIDKVHAFPRANFETDMHMQEFFEINIITRGSGTHYIGDSSIKTKVGDVFVIPPKVEHGFKGGEGFDVFHILISDKFIQNNINDLQKLPSFFILFNAEPIMRGQAKAALHLRLNDKKFDNLSAILNQTLECRKQSDPFQCFTRSGLIMILISFLCREYTQNIDNAVASEPESDEAFLKVISYVHEHYSEKISIDDLAKIACLSRSTFIRKFNKVCKMPPLDYIIKSRIDAAANMLLSTEASLVDIAFKCGFYDAAHLSHTFKKIKGVSPTEYRENAK